MDRQLDRHYKQGLQTLEDLYKLGGAELSPLLDRIHFHMGAIKRDATESIESLESFKNLKGFLESQVDRQVERLFLSSREGCQFNYSKKTDSMTLFDWERVVDLLPYSFDLMNLFKFAGNVELSFNENELALIGEVNAEFNFTSIREDVYSITRKLLSEKALLTFDVFETSNEDQYKLSLKLDYSHREDRYFVYELGKQNDQVIAFSNSFENYKISEEIAGELSEHLCLYVDSDLNLQKLSRIPEYAFEADWKGEFIHFPFLFRPVSLIIEGKGLAMTKATFEELSAAGSGRLSSQGQDVEKGSKFNSLYIDFFSVFNS